MGLGFAIVKVVEHEYQAKHKVFFVDSEYQQKNAQIIHPGRLVHTEFVEGDAAIKVFIVNSKNDADIWITKNNFPK